MGRPLLPSQARAGSWMGNGAAELKPKLRVSVGVRVRRRVRLSLAVRARTRVWG